MVEHEPIGKQRRPCLSPALAPSDSLGYRFSRKSHTSALAQTESSIGANHVCSIDQDLSQELLRMQDTNEKNTSAARLRCDRPSNAE